MKIDNCTVTTGGGTGDWYIADGSQWTQWAYPKPTKEMVEDDIYSTWRGVYGSIEDKPLKKERKVGMETLYQVIVVTKDREILLEEKVVAETAEEAKFYIEIKGILRAKNLKLQDITILCHAIGDVKVRKEVQKVKVVDKDEE